MTMTCSETGETWMGGCGERAKNPQDSRQDTIREGRVTGAISRAEPTLRAKHWLLLLIDEESET
jgi:hypothetical protein